jgi:hypothetical protein
MFHYVPTLPKHFNVKLTPIFQVLPEVLQLALGADVGIYAGAFAHQNAH